MATTLSGVERQYNDEIIYNRNGLNDGLSDIFYSDKTYSKKGIEREFTHSPITTGNGVNANIATRINQCLEKLGIPFWIVAQRTTKRNRKEYPYYKISWRHIDKAGWIDDEGFQKKYPNIRPIPEANVKSRLYKDYGILIRDLYSHPEQTIKKAIASMDEIRKEFVSKKAVATKIAQGKKAQKQINLLNKQLIVAVNKAKTAKTEKTYALYIDKVETIKKKINNLEEKHADIKLKIDALYKGTIPKFSKKVKEAVSQTKEKVVKLVTNTTPSKKVSTIKNDIESAVKPLKNVVPASDLKAIKADVKETIVDMQNGDITKTEAKEEIKDIITQTTAEAVEAPTVNAGATASQQEILRMMLEDQKKLFGDI